MVEVTLTWPEMWTAVMIGALRQIQNLAKGRQDEYDAPQDQGWEFHIQGACGEKAAAKDLGVYWSGNLGDLKADDVGPFQVRTASGHGYHLLLHKKDQDEKKYILVTGTAPRFRLVGWCYGKEGKLKKYWWDKSKTKRPAYFVPQTALHPIESLREPGRAA